MVGNAVKKGNADLVCSSWCKCRLGITQLFSPVLLGMCALNPLLQSILVIAFFAVGLPAMIALSVVVCIYFGFGWKTWIVLTSIIAVVVLYAGYIDEKRAKIVY